MRALVVFLLVALGCSLTEGRNLTKCELKDELMKAIGELPDKAKQKGLTEEVLVAHVVCHAEFASGFNTSAVNKMNPKMGQHPKRGKRDKATSRTQTPPTMPPHAADDWTLYGIFQLGNQLVCSDGKTPSPNICGMDCSKLVDSDIHDDISCLLDIFKDLVENGFGAPYWEKLRMMIRLIYQEECRDIKASQYFANCS